MGLILAAACSVAAQTQVPVSMAATGQTSAAAVPAQISPATAEVVKLAEAGSSDDVILAYVQNTQGPFGLSADGIIYLKDLGVSSAVVTAMLNHDTTWKNQNPNTVPVVTAPPPVVQPAPPVDPASSAAAPAPDYVGAPPAQVNYFYDQLAPYGSWVSLPDYGWCWQPSTIVIHRGWTPYCDGGHWVYTDAGWFWQSDYSWGWAPFHYGRWYLHERCGWVWLPDTVWAPAWVTWRVSGDHCGWAPLPPHADFDVRFGFRFNGISVKADFDFGLRPDHFTFIAFKDFQDHDFAHHRLAPAQVTKVYNQTTIINNYTVEKTTVVNRGIPLERVTAATHTEMRKVAIRDVPSGHMETARAAGPGKVEAAVFRPELKMPAKPPVHAVAQRLDEQHPVVHHAEVKALVTEHKPITSPAFTAPTPRRTAFETPAHSTPTPAPRQDFKQPVAPQHYEQNKQPVSAPPAHQELKQQPVVEHYEQNKQPAVTFQQHEEVKQPAVTTQHQPPPAQDAYRSEKVPSNESAHIATSTPAPTARGSSSLPSQNTHVYYPKGFYQLGPGRSGTPMYQGTAPSMKDDKSR